jgi:hypothetical protein
VQPLVAVMVEEITEAVAATEGMTNAVAVVVRVQVQAAQVQEEEIIKVVVLTEGHANS